MSLSDEQRGLVQVFDRCLQGAGLAPSTRRVYRLSVARWLRVGGQLGHLDSALLTSYLCARRRTLSQSSINNDIKALRRFYELMAQLGHCSAAIVAAIPSQRQAPPRLVRTLTVEQIADVLAAPDPSTWAGFRDTVLLRVLCDTGLKTSDIAALQVGSVLDDRTLYLPPNRRKPARYVAISAELHALLDRYIQRRGEMRPGRLNALWLNRYGRPLADRSIWKKCCMHMRQALGRSCGCALLASSGKPWQGHYPHLLRASLAQHYLERGLDVLRVAQLMGYADVQQVQRHAGVDLIALRAAVAHHPRGLRLS